MSFNVGQMDKETLRETLETLAWMAAKGAYRRTNPNRPEQEADAWAERNLHHYDDEALGYLAMIAIEEEKESGRR